MSKNVIYVGPVDKGYEPLLGEDKCTSVVAEQPKPGDLIRIDATGLAVVVGKDKTGPADFTPVFVAKEQGSQYGATVETAYTADDFVPYVILRKGDFINVRAKAGTVTTRGTVLGKAKQLTAADYGLVSSVAVDGSEQALFTATGAIGSAVTADGDLIKVQVI